MIHPSYKDLMNVVNANVEEGEEPIVNSRYSIVLATAKRARQIIDGAEPLVKAPCDRPLSIAVAELNESKVKILTGDEEAIEDITEGDIDEFEEDDELELNVSNEDFDEANADEIMDEDDNVLVEE